MHPSQEMKNTLLCCYLCVRCIFPIDHVPNMILKCILPIFISKCSWVIQIQLNVILVLWGIRLTLSSKPAGLCNVMSSRSNDYVNMCTNFPPLYGIWQYSEFDPGHINSIFHFDVPNKAFSQMYHFLLRRCGSTDIWVLGAFFRHI